MSSVHTYSHDELPVYFDARVNWTSWIHPVRDQRNCASSWAFSTVGKSLTSGYFRGSFYVLSYNKEIQWLSAKKVFCIISIEYILLCFFFDIKCGWLSDVAADRLAIESQGLLTNQLSPQHLLSCNTRRGQMGCRGGSTEKAWWFIKRKGYRPIMHSHVTW